MNNVCEVYEQGIKDLVTLLSELSDVNLRAAVTNATAAIALNRHEASAQALVRCMRAHVQCQREDAQRAAE